MLLPFLGIGQEYAYRGIGFKHSDERYYYQMYAQTLVKTSDALYVFYIDRTTQDPIYKKSLDGGFTWQDSIVIKGSITCQLVSVWYDGWSGISGNIINLSYFDTGSDKFYYRSLDADNDSFGTEYTIVDFANSANANLQLSITRAFGGNLYAVGMSYNNLNYDFYKKSTDNGATWSDLATPSSLSTTSGFCLYPDFQADQNDIIMFHLYGLTDDSLFVRRYDQSANTWGKIYLGLCVRESNLTSSPHNVSVALDTINSKLYVSAWDDYGSASAILQAWDVTASDTNKLTKVVQASVVNTMGNTALTVDNNGDVIAFYLGPTSGAGYIVTSSRSAGDANICYRKSSDGGITWSGEYVMSDFIASAKWLTTFPMSEGKYYIQYGDLYYSNNIVIPLRIKKINGINPY